MTEKWPAELPQYPLSKGYKITERKVFRRRELDVGLPHSRRIFGKSPTFISLNWKFTDEEYKQHFPIWYHKIKMGADPFLITLRNGLGLQECKVRFTQQPEVIKRGNYYVVSGSLECLDWPVLNKEKIELFIQDNPQALRKAFTAFNKLVNEKMGEIA